MARINLKHVTLRDTVQFHGPSDLSLQLKDGCELALDTDMECIVGNNPKRPDPLCIPLSNVKSFLILTPAESKRQDDLKKKAADDAEAAKLEAAAVLKHAQDQAKLPPERREKTKRGVTKFIKNPETGVIEEVQV